MTRSLGVVAVTTGPAMRAAYQVAFLDWLACAHAGRGERAARAARALGSGLTDHVAYAATAGHVLDFDDTFSPGVAHVSAACAPAALVVAASAGRSVGEMLDAYAAGFEAMAAVAESAHPRLYDGGWHPTAVCAPIGAAVTAGALLGLTRAQRREAVALAALRAGGMRGAFGSDGKALGVGLAAAAGVQAALLAGAGARVDPARAVNGPLGFCGVLGVCWPPTLEPDAGPADGADPADTAGPGPAIGRNWIKLHPSCLGTHAPIEAAAVAHEEGADAARGPGPGRHREPEGPIEVTVNPLARQAAHLDAVTDGLQAKFSIPYCVAHTLRHGPPGVRDFAGAVDPVVAGRAARVGVRVDAALPPWGAVLQVAGGEPIRVPCPRGAPERPVTAADLAGKLRDLAGQRLERVLDDPGAPAGAVLDRALG